MTRRIMLVAHPSRADAHELAGAAARAFTAHGIDVAVVTDETTECSADGCELVVVLGGDGTILRAAQLSRGSGAPLLGINLGHIGFLAEVEREDLEGTVRRIVEREYTVEHRMSLAATARHDGEVIASTWALNEVTVEKAARERMLELSVEIDGRPLSTWGCDGVIMATPTGSTAYAFSAGGPVVWPDQDVLLVVPISAHALFARPLVLSPRTRLAVEIVPHPNATGVMWCDGARRVELPVGARIEVCRSEIPVKLARLTSSPFTDRLVEKFHLSVQGWRGTARAEGRVRLD